MDAPPIQYVQTADGWDIAYTVRGAGVQLLYLAVPQVSHVRLEWDVYGQSHFASLAERFTLVRYDHRGSGMSSRGLTDSFRIEDFELDLAAVVGRAGARQFVVLTLQGMSRLAVRFAARHPDRVLGLVLFNPNTGDPALDVHEAPPSWFQEAARNDWDQFVGTFARAPFPLMEPRAIQGLVRESITQADCLRLLAGWNRYVVADELPRLQVPTLVVAPSASFLPGAGEEASRRIAARIPGARLAVFDMPAGDTPNQAAERFGLLIEEFVRTLAGDENARASGLSTRELEVLRLLAAGHTNQQIAAELVISTNTVRRHVSNIFDKTEVANRAQAAIYARDHGLA